MYQVFFVPGTPRYGYVQSDTNTCSVPTKVSMVWVVRDVEDARTRMLRSVGMLWDAVYIPRKPCSGPLEIGKMPGCTDPQKRYGYTCTESLIHTQVPVLRIVRDAEDARMLRLRMRHERRCDLSKPLTDLETVE